MSGIATKTNEFVKAAAPVKILDTRKTLPAYRPLAKYAVTCGGAVNHRIGLHDMVMIKDNHSDGCGGITEAVKRVREKWGDKYKIEVEARNLAEVEEALIQEISELDRPYESTGSDDSREVLDFFGKESDEWYMKNPPLIGRRKLSESETG